jgi:hypothetical protein
VIYSIAKQFEIVVEGEQPEIGCELFTFRA